MSPRSGSSTGVPAPSRAIELPGTTLINDLATMATTCSSPTPASWPDNELYRLDGGKKTGVTKLPNGQLDGVVHLADGSFVITSWYASSIFRGKAGSEFKPILESINTPADIGYDTKRHLLLVPNSSENHVTMHPVK